MSAPLLLTLTRLAVALPGPLIRPLARDGALAEDALPTATELTHWSVRLTHAAIAIGVAVGIALAVHGLVFWLLRRFVRRIKRNEPSDERAGELAGGLVALRQFRQSVRWAMIATGLSFAAAGNPLVRTVWNCVAVVAVPALVGWVLLALVRTLAEVLEYRTGIGEDWVTARSRRTRIALLSRTAMAIIIVVTAAMIMLSFPPVRHIGATLIASAGLLTLAVGAAAQPALKSLIAGVQIALTQPMRIGDHVQIDGENGRVEDIRFSYVIIRNADERRVIVPTVKFLESTFQNWTRVAGITGSVRLPIAAGVAIGPIREAFMRLLAEHEEWDRRSGTLTVSAANPGWTEIELSFSATGPNELVPLRSKLREEMLEWLRTDYRDAVYRPFFAPPAS